MRLRLSVAALFAALSTVFASAALITAFGESWVGGPTERGETIPVRVPIDDLFTNIGSRIDGAGMCVDTSIETQARYLGLDQYRGFRDYWASVEEGGNTSSGVDRQLKAWGKQKGFTPK